MKKPQILNKSQIAAVFALNRGTISGWVLKGCPIIRRGRPGYEAQFDPQKLLDWRIADLLEQGVEEEYIMLDVQAILARLRQLKKETAR